MEKRAPFVEERHTNWSFELPGLLTTHAYLFVAANAAIREAWIRISRASCGSDLCSLGLANENGGHCMSLRQLRIRRERTRQKRKALRMLALSGVVRPSRVELRYVIPLPNIEDRSSAFQEKSAASIRPSSLLLKFFELMSWSTKDDGSLGQYLHRNNQPRLRKCVSACICSSP